MKKHTLLIAAILAIPALLWGTAACADSAAEPAAAVAAQGQSEAAGSPAVTPSANAEVPTVGTIAVKELVGKKLGVPQGTVQDIYLMETYPQLELQRHNFEADMMLALEKGICDAAIMDDVICYALARKKPNILLFEDPSLPKNFMGMAFNHTDKGKELCRQFNEFLTDLRQSGELEAICNKWIVNTETAQMPKLDIPTEGEPIIVGMEPCTEPIVFMRGKEIVGMDAELIYRFAAHIGRPVEIKNIDYYGLLTAVAAGQVDIASSGFLITAERGESVLFSDPYYTSCSIIATRKDDAPVASSDIPELGTIAVKELVGKKLGVPQGTVQDIYLMETYPQLELQRHNFEADMMLALEKGICDAAIMDDVICYALARKKPNILLFEDPSLPKNFMGMAFNHTAKGKELCRQFNEFLADLRESGELEEICSNWIRNTETAQMPKLDIPTEGEPIIVGMEPCTEPIVFMRGEEIVGMDAELIYRFAAHIGRPVEIKNIDYYGLLTAVAAGKVDIASSGFLITAERGESVLFSDPYYTSISVIATRKDLNLKGEPSAVTKAAQGIIGSITDSFYRNIIAEKRYMLIWDGLKATFAIAFFSTLLGTVVGAAICYLRMSHSKFWQWIARVYIDIMRGTPILILLMLMYYVAFAGTQVEALYVAIITFSLNFGAYVSEMFRSAITSIDRGQSEAGIAMGFSPFHSFYYIVLPQAIKRVLPVYKGEVISLIKNTSVVGYIAIADLTKMTDIIRARTFDPFFPLLMVAILYFLIAWLFTFILDRASKRIR
ncbi:MAG: ABC transporter permease subunit [Akkermansia sp.]|nr:ABC transporter permease subunit [Akkermansia sp.]